jgi:serine/threonine-protein kinase HipA
MDELLVYLNETPLGVLRRDSKGKLLFRYDDDYLSRGPGIPLSLSMPLFEREHRDERVTPFLWGLLPDNALLLQRWASRFHVSASNPFALLREIGEDCAGAIRFLPSERAAEASRGGLVPLTTEDIARRLSELKRDPSLAREPADVGRFSLAGAQAKTAFQKKEGRWFLPSGSEPTTHIFKPPRPDLAGHVENEHFCLRFAARMGLRSAHSEVVRFDDELAIVVERYDRTSVGGKLVRIHQEDMCQALSIHPGRKYESEGGPGIPKIMDLLNYSSDSAQDRDRFMEAIVLNYILVGSDAHAKNYSLLLGSRGAVRLAPLYDIASLLPYASRPRDFRMAMRVDRAYRDDQIFPHHFVKMARQCEYPVKRLQTLIVDFLERAPAVASETRQELLESRVQHPVVDILTEQIRGRSEELLRRFREAGF